MYVIVGLGNPGEKYSGTRHNIGWAVLEDCIEKNDLPRPVDSAKYAGKVSEGILGSEEVAILFPGTFMNKSGSAVRKLITGKAEAQKCIVVYDDVDLPFGEVKISYGKGSGGHRGVESIINALGTRDFIRIRIGIASRGFFGSIQRPKGEALTHHVLSKFKKREVKSLKVVNEKVGEMIRAIMRDGVEAAMNQFN